MFEIEKKSSKVCFIKIRQSSLTLFSLSSKWTNGKRKRKEEEEKKIPKNVWEEKRRENGGERWEVRKNYISRVVRRLRDNLS